jgi:hypothetical protein
MAYDSARQRTVLFGGVVAGAAGGQSVGDTWEWNGEFWTQVGDIGPSARCSHAMAYDVARAQVILFGGNLSPNPFGGKSDPNGDTWAWDGQAWTQLADTGPSARQSASGMAYDSARDRVVLFGGDGNQDTWEWNGVEWTQTAEDGPPGRENAVMAYDSVREHLVLFGGNGADGSFDDTWELDGVAWTRVAHTGPQGRTNAAMVFSGTRTILFGGRLVGNAVRTLRDTWEWSGKFWTQRQDIGPLDRAGHRIVYDSNRDRVVLFGGQSILPPALLDDTWEVPGSSITLTGLTFPSLLISSGTATVSLSGPSPIGGITVSLIADVPLEILEVPGSVVVAEGKTSADFPVKNNASQGHSPVTASVTARLGTSNVTSSVHIG